MSAYLAQLQHEFADLDVHLLAQVIEDLEHNAKVSRQWLSEQESYLAELPRDGSPARARAVERLSAFRQIYRIAERDLAEAKEAHAKAQTEAARLAAMK